MKVSAWTLLSLWGFTIFGIIAHIWPETIGGKVAAALSNTFAVIGHFQQPAIKTAEDGGKK